MSLFSAKRNFVFFLFFSVFLSFFYTELIHARESKEASLPDEKEKLTSDSLEPSLTKQNPHTGLNYVKKGNATVGKKSQKSSEHERDEKVTNPQDEKKSEKKKKKNDGKVEQERKVGNKPLINHCGCIKCKHQRKNEVALSTSAASPQNDKDDKVEEVAYIYYTPSSTDDKNENAGEPDKQEEESIDDEKNDSGEMLFKRFIFFPNSEDYQSDNSKDTANFEANILPLIREEFTKMKEYIDSALKNNSYEEQTTENLTVKQCMSTNSLVNLISKLIENNEYNANNIGELKPDEAVNVQPVTSVSDWLLPLIQFLSTPACRATLAKLVNKLPMILSDINQVLNSYSPIPVTTRIAQVVLRHFDENAYDNNAQLNEQNRLNQLVYTPQQQQLPAAESTDELIESIIKIMQDTNFSSQQPIASASVVSSAPQQPVASSSLIKNVQLDTLPPNLKTIIVRHLGRTGESPAKQANPSYRIRFIFPSSYNNENNPETNAWKNNANSQNLSQPLRSLPSSSQEQGNDNNTTTGVSRVYFY